MTAPVRRRPWWRLERRREPVAPKQTFARRVMRSFALAGLTVMAALAIGVIGYHVAGGLGWLDSLYNASMILGGMGPVDNRPEIPSAEKWFASAYALFSGFAILIIAGVMFGPIFHRFIHRFHADIDEDH